MAGTLAEKVWDAHVVRRAQGEPDLLYIDLHLLHEVTSPQLGLTQPGMTIVCGDSHTSTHGAFGALAFGVGTSEVEHVLATQALSLTPFKTLAVTVDGELPEGVSAKDVVLAVIAKVGTAGGQG